MRGTSPYSPADTPAIYDSHPLLPRLLRNPVNVIYMDSPTDGWTDRQDGCMEWDGLMDGSIDG